MSFTGIALMHALARQDNKEPYFFSRFNFSRMKERKNTHFCFHCGGGVGFQPQKIGWRKYDIGKPTNQFEHGYDPMKRHDQTHANAVIGNAHKYTDVWDWLQKEIGKKKDFPYIVHVPSI